MLGDLRRSARRNAGRLSIALLALLASACGAGTDSEFLEQTEEAKQPIQLIQTKKRWIAWSEVLYKPEYPGTATGVVHIPISTRDDGIPVRGTCGVTFVSPQYAITAAHCVDKRFNITLDTELKVDYHTIEGITEQRIDEQAKVTGTFPNYQRSRLTSAEGYKTKRHTCKVVRRCDRSNRYGRDNCPFTEQADVALLHCPTRTWQNPWIWPAPEEEIGEHVAMYWFHEILDMPIRDPQKPGSLEQDRWDHYGKLADRGDNYHYLGGTRNQLVPLVSRSWGEWSTRSLETNSTTTDTYTNLGGCHGSSGSGVFRKSGGFWQLLGPVSLGAFSGLCSSTKVVSGIGDYSDPILAYVKPKYTHKLATVPEVNTDRQSGPG